MNKNAFLLGLSLTLLVACGQTPTGRTPQTLPTNLLELQFKDLNTDQPQSQAQSLVSTQNGIERQAFTQIQSGLTFQTLHTQLARDAVGKQRLLQGVYRVTNNTGRDLKYLTFIPVNTDDTDGNAANNAMSPTIGSTALTGLKYYDGSDASVKASSVTLGQGRKIDVKTGLASVDPEATVFTPSLTLPGLSLTPPAGLTINRYGTGGWQLPITIPKGSSAVVSFGVMIQLAATGKEDPADMSLLVAYAEDQTPLVEPPPADDAPTFDMSLPISTAGSSYTLSASSPEGLEYKWDFGDGTSTVNGMSASHTYQAPGTYTVTVYSTNSDGVTQKNTTQVQVIPEIQDVVKRRAVDDSLTVEFDLGNPIPGLDYQIDYGDGTSGNTSKSTHTYAKIGSYDYTVTIRDTRGLTQTSAVRAQAVTDAPIVYRQKSFVTLWRKAPQASFSFTTNTGLNVNVANMSVATETATVSFDATDSKDVNKEFSALTYEWDFGNGQTATGAQASTTFTSQKAYLVTLKVTNKWGLSSQKRTFIFVRHPAQDWFLRAKYLASSTVMANEAPGGDLTHETSPLNQATSFEQEGGISKQTVTFTFNDFPYVLSPNNLISSGIIYSVDTTGKRMETLCEDFRLAFDGKVVIFNDSHYIYGTKSQFCKGVIYYSGTIGKIPAKQNYTLIQQTSQMTHQTTMYAYNTLSVPKVFVSVVPDDFIPGGLASPVIRDNYTTDVNGNKQYVMRALFRESDVVGGILEFNVPVLAMDTANKFLAGMNGLFQARFASPDMISSSVEDNIMVNGRANIKVRLIAANFTEGGKEINLSQVVSLSSSNDCSNLDSAVAIASKISLYGCDTFSTTNVFPVANAPLNIQEFPKALQNMYTFGNRTYFGKQANVLKALKIYSQLGHAVGHTFVEWAAPFALWEEKVEDLQKATDALVADGKISPLEYGKLTFMNLAMLASNIPAGPLRPPSYAAVAQMSRNSVGATADALESFVEPTTVKGMKLSEVNSLLLSNIATVTRLLENCGQRCVGMVDDYLYSLGDKTLFNKFVRDLETQLNKQQFGGMNPGFKITLGIIEAGCPNIATGITKLAAGAPFSCAPTYFKLSKTYKVTGADYTGIKGFPATTGPTWRGMAQAHHALPKQWANKCLKAGGLGGLVTVAYNENLAPTIGLETNSNDPRAHGTNQPIVNGGLLSVTTTDLPHTTINELQGTRRRNNVSQGCSLSDLYSQISYMVNDLMTISLHKQPNVNGFDVLKCTVLANYNMLLNLGIPAANLAHNIPLQPGDDIFAHIPLIDGDRSYAFEKSANGSLILNQHYDKTICPQFY